MMNSTISEKTSQINIIEVYDHNFISELKRISAYLEDFNYVGMDTEFPGVVYGINTFTQDFYYKTMKLNVDSLKLIQLGITLCNSKGEYPSDITSWQFNLRFNCDTDEFESSSLLMLSNCGIDFEKWKTQGIDHLIFAEYFLLSGLVLNPDVHWISFHGSYDFAYWLKLLSNKDLPSTEGDFTRNLIEYFPSHYDIKVLVHGKDNWKGGLNRLAQYLEVWRVGKKHQAGSDSVVTASIFFKLIENNFITKTIIANLENVLFGIGEGANDKETMTYTKFNIGLNYPLNPSVNSSNNNHHQNFVYMKNAQFNGFNNQSNIAAFNDNVQMNMIFSGYTNQGQQMQNMYNNYKMFIQGQPGLIQQIEEKSDDNINKNSCNVGWSSNNRNGKNKKTVVGISN